MNLTKKAMVIRASELFNKLYDELYDGIRVEEDWQVDRGEDYLRYPSLKPFLYAFNEYRHDFISSDRETNAWYLLIEKMGGWRSVAKEYKALTEIA